MTALKAALAHSDRGGRSQALLSARRRRFFQHPVGVPARVIRAALSLRALQPDGSERNRHSSTSRALRASLAALLILRALAASPAFAGALTVETPDAETILRRAQKSVLGETAAYTLRMTVLRPGKPDRVVEMKGFKKGDALGLVRYTAPPKERGTAYLRNGQNTYLFLPSAEKVVRVGPKQNFGGGDFSNGDIFRLSMTHDYTPTLVGEETLEGQACWKLELKAKDRSVAYDRVLYWVRSDGTFFPVRADYHAISGKRLKWLTLSEAGRLGARTRPLLLTMESALEPGARTLLRFLAIEDDVPLDDRLFTPSALERGE